MTKSMLEVGSKEYYEDVYKITPDMPQELIDILTKEKEDALKSLEVSEDDEEYNMTEDEINELVMSAKGNAQQELYDFSLVDANNLDNIVKKYSPLIGLKGESYHNATKMVFYSVLANQLKFNSFTFENKAIDLRLPLLIQLKAGHGKKNYVTFIKKTIQEILGYDLEGKFKCKKIYQEPTSYHPEQFVGKIVVHENKKDPELTEYVKVYGNLASDFLLIDEGHSLLTRKESEECLKYIRTALDPIGANTIEKKQVNVPNEHKLSYAPNCSICILTQPITNVNEELLVRGSFRRFIVLFIDVPLNEHLDALSSCTFLTLKEDVHKKMWEDWIAFNQKLEDCRNIKYACSEENMKIIIDYIVGELRGSIQGAGPEVTAFFESLSFTIYINLFKMAAIRAILQRSEYKSGMTVSISDKHIKAAIQDWHKVWIPQIQWIARQLNMESFNPLKWNEKIHGSLMSIIELSLSNVNFTITDIIKLYSKKMPTYSENMIKNNVYKGLHDLYLWGYVDRSGMGKKSGYTFRLIKKEKE